MKESVLVVGSDGFIGKALSETLAQQGFTVHKTTRRQDRVNTHTAILDLSSDISSWAPPANIKIAFICAAVAQLAPCRDNPKGSFQVNVTSTEILVKKLIQKGVFVVFLSTNQVFNGATALRKDSDPTSPTSEYGRQKAEIEKRLSALGSSLAIVRLTKVIGADTALHQNWVRSLLNGEVIHPFSDLKMAPIPVTFVAEALIKIGVGGESGTFQLSGEKDVSYEEVGYFIAKQLKVDSSLVQPKKAGSLGFDKDALPAHTSLDRSRFESTHHVKVPLVWETIQSLIESWKK